MKHLNNKLCYRWEAIQKIQQGDFPYPKSVTVYPSQTCNLNCKWCCSIEKRGTSLFIDLELFYKMCREWKSIGVKAIAFEGGGEPCLHPKFDDMVTYAHRLGFKIGVITNGTIWKNSFALCTWVRVGVNALNKEDYEKFTGVDLYDKVIRTVCKLKKSNAKIGLKFLSSKWLDYKGIDYLNFCKRLEVSFYQVKELRNHNRTGLKNKVKKQCGLTPLRAVVNYDGMYHVCPFFAHHPNTHIGSESLISIWNTLKHKEAIRNIKDENCSKYDCPMLEIDINKIKELEVEFI